ncbi:MAG TPA: phosphonate C-P lyase system protein PhnG [Rhodopila sp.]|jgi:alpha-D-ribose 1-methylphosphonate 5-triphosphate synthase subunit PhnG|nr:phosphonate C-P lyase system protein PhnG [Rhodopila sp.]
MNDTALPDQPHQARRRWMAVLARAHAGSLQSLLADCGALPAHAVLRGPDGGLVMVRGRAGGGGAAFNLGEMTVTRCTVRTETGFIGHAYIAGRDEKRAELAALADALMQDPDRADEIERHVITPLERKQIEHKTERARKAAGTRVQFFAMQTTRS